VTTSLASTPVSDRVNTVAASVPSYSLSDAVKLPVISSAVMSASAYDTLSIS
jgi:hypothetical protein